MENDENKSWLPVRDDGDCRIMSSRRRLISHSFVHLFFICTINTWEIANC